MIVLQSLTHPLYKKRIRPKGMLFFFLCFILVLPKYVFSEERIENPPIYKKQETAFSLSSLYIADFFVNMHGGYKRGGGIIGMGMLESRLNTEKAKLWRGGSFVVSGCFTHGKTPSSEYFGDAQIASNIEAGNYVFLQDLWYSHQIKNLELSLGLQDINNLYLISPNGFEYIHSSFGIPPILSIDIPVPTFPLTGIGLNIRWDINPQLFIQSALFDGNQTPLQNNPHNLSWKIDLKNEGLLALSEMGWGDPFANYFRIGCYYHSPYKEFDTITLHFLDQLGPKYGFYLLNDLVLWKNVLETKKVNFFSQLALNPTTSQSPTAYYIGMGVTYYGFQHQKNKDIIGIGIAHTGKLKIKNEYETAFEIFYKKKLTEHITLQPDIQYIVNPNGKEIKLKNALIGFLRIQIKI